MPDSLFKDAVRSGSNTFFKVIGAAIALFFIAVALFAISSESVPRTTRLVPAQTHTWRILPYNPSTPTIMRIPVTGPIGIKRGISKVQVEHILADLVDLDLKPGMLKGILLYINSPGGAADDSDSILRMLLEFKAKMKLPIYAYVDGLCASGGMMISLSADKIIASRPSLVGHVGVLMPTVFNVAQPMEKLGIQAKTLFAGKDKDALNPFRPWAQDEGAAEQALLNTYYERFVKLVAEHRPRIREENLREAGAKLYPAEEALELGYIDQVRDSYYDSLEEIASSLDIINHYQVIELQPYFSFSEMLGPEGACCKTESIHHYLRLPGDFPPELANKPLYLYHPQK